MQKTSYIDANTIARFGEQWHIFTENKDYFGSSYCLADICGPLLDIKEFDGKDICDIGSGTGRIVNMLIHAGASHVTAVEPSKSFEILEKNTMQFRDKVHLIHSTAESLNMENKFDYVVSFGVLHHIVDPIPAIQAIHRALKPGGKCVIWLYGLEGNRVYLSIFNPLRKITTHLSSSALFKISRALTVCVNFYIKLCSILPLPMHHYMKKHLGKLSSEQRTMTIYDQLNPAYAKYYKKTRSP